MLLPAPLPCLLLVFVVLASASHLNLRRRDSNSVSNSFISDVQSTSTSSLSGSEEVYTSGPRETSSFTTTGSTPSSTDIGSHPISSLSRRAALPDNSGDSSKSSIRMFTYTDVFMTTIFSLTRSTDCRGNTTWHETRTWRTTTTNSYVTTETVYDNTTASSTVESTRSAVPSNYCTEIVTSLTSQVMCRSAEDTHPCPGLNPTSSSPPPEVPVTTLTDGAFTVVTKRVTARGIKETASPQLFTPTQSMLPRISGPSKNGGPSNITPTPSEASDDQSGRDSGTRSEPGETASGIATLPTAVTAGSVTSSVGPSQAIVSDRTFAVGPSTTPTTAVLNDQTISSGPEGVGLASAPTTATINGQTVSLGPGGTGLPTTTVIPPPTTGAIGTGSVQAATGGSGKWFGKIGGREGVLLMLAVGGLLVL